MILHITTRGAARRAERDGHYTHPSLNDEGFIHCSNPEQVLGPANAYYRGQDDLVLLVIDPGLVDADILYEDSYNSGTRYPHIYGRLPWAAVSDVVDFPVNKDGGFDKPPDCHSRGPVCPVGKPIERVRA